MAMESGGSRAWNSIRSIIAMLLLTGVACQAAKGRNETCRRVDFQAEVSAGQEWKTQIGRGWVFRLLPISPSAAGYTGWDLVVDRNPPAGYPDALLVATLPYNSINEREIGTTFGLRAQDAIGWNPRSFRFLTNLAEFQQSQQWFRQLTMPDAKIGGGGSTSDISEITQRLLKLQNGASNGEFRLLDARLQPGTADPKPFATGWAVTFSRTRHQIDQVPVGQSTPQGRLIWIRFALTLWLPADWALPSGTRWVPGSCRE